MATSYKTPGVYVEEIVKFPPSIAQVETAIPAFIGYTEKATNKINGDLKGVPTRITSMLDYETFFGFAKPETTISVTINDTLVNGTEERSIVVDHPTVREPFLMYYSLQMYFANGGGTCYIVSVGRYGNDLDAGDTQVTSINNSNDFNTGLGLVEKVDEVTLIVFPDATGLSTIAEFCSLYNNALTQCNKLQDRFTIIDTLAYDAVSPTDTNIADLRNNISSNKDDIKYGAVYYPFLKTILDYQYDETNVSVTHSSQDSQALAADIDAASEAAVDITQVLTDSTDLLTDLTDVDVLIQAMTAGDALTNKSDVTDAIQPIIDALTGIIITGNTAVTAALDAATAANEDPLVATAATNAGLALTTALTTPAEALPTLISALETHVAVIDGAGVGTLVKTESTATKATLTTISVVIQAVIDLIDPTIIDAIDVAQAVDTNGILDGLTLDAVETVDNATYNKILTEIGNLPLELPPSSTMAGIYAKIDSTRGVWKAPANVSLNYVVQPSLQITHDDQKDLNVDTIAGKSINAIRTFTGKGVLVWGARTLAGNDNEWRYVSVRRFFNMAEESIKKATEQFVFEPNDKNTWVRVKAMIDNFLTVQWRAGALAGPAPDKAFYVKVGLGETMTAQDILKGYMIIEIGMAVVRPAEFIILKFSHKMQEA